MENNGQNKVSKKTLIIDIIFGILLIGIIMAELVLTRYNENYSAYCGIAFNITFAIYELKEGIIGKKKYVKVLNFVVAALFLLVAVLKSIDLFM